MAMEDPRVAVLSSQSSKSSVIFKSTTRVKRSRSQELWCRLKAGRFVGLNETTSQDRCQHNFLPCFNKRGFRMQNSRSEDLGLFEGLGRRLTVCKWSLIRRVHVSYAGQRIKSWLGDKSTWFETFERRKHVPNFSLLLCCCGYLGTPRVRSLNMNQHNSEKLTI